VGQADSGAEGRIVTLDPQTMPRRSPSCQRAQIFNAPPARWPIHVSPCRFPIECLNLSRNTCHEPARALSNCRDFAVATMTRYPLGGNGPRGWTVYGSQPHKLGSVLLTIVVGVRVLNVRLLGRHKVLGGDALNHGSVGDGHFYIESHGQTKEVTEGLFAYSRRQASTLKITQPAFLAAFVGILSLDCMLRNDYAPGSRHLAARWLVGNAHVSMRTRNPPVFSVKFVTALAAAWSSLAQLLSRIRSAGWGFTRWPYSGAQV